jgi:hypothetical protein
MAQDWSAFLSNLGQSAISRAADAELTKNFGPSNEGQFFQGEDGIVSRAGQPSITAPTVTVTGKPLDMKMLMIAAVGLVAVVLLLKR